MDNSGQAPDYTLENELALMSVVVDLLSRILASVPADEPGRVDTDRALIHTELRDAIMTVQFALMRWRLLRGMEAGLISIGPNLPNEAGGD